MKTRIFSPDIECDSCVAVLKRTLSKTPGVQSSEITTDYIDIQHDKKTSPSKLVQTIKKKGYRASLHPRRRIGIRERAREFLTDKQKYVIEWRAVKYALITLTLLLILQGALAFFIEGSRPGFIAAYWPWILYLTLSVVAIGTAIWHFKAYRTTVTCMTGMMIGMTIGMQSGMLIGAVIGITNGFFWGATVGMVFGVIVGAWTGKCCGIMGVMEGMMAGIMGGTMGAMITVMMFYEHIHFFMPLYVFLNVVILASFSHMLFEELVEEKEIHVKPAGLLTFTISCTLTLTALMAVLLLAPSPFLVIA